MPSLSDAIKSASGLYGYEQASPVEKPTGPSLDRDYSPGRNSMIRCPLPTLWSESADSLRQFYLNGQIPQSRIMTPQAAPTSGSSVSTTKVISTTVQAGATALAVSGSGTSSASTGSVGASQTVVSTSVLDPGNKFISSLPISKSFQLLSVAANSPCRVQLYGNLTAQSQDVGRALDGPLPAGTAQNVISDVVLDTAPYTWNYQNRTGANADSPQESVIYATITNLDAVSDTITLTVQFVSLENA